MGAHNFDYSIIESEFFKMTRLQNYKAALAEFLLLFRNLYYYYYYFHHFAEKLKHAP